MPSSRGSFQPRNRTQVSHIAGGLTAEPQGKPKNTGLSSLSLLHQIFPTQESNWGLLHCRQILCQLSYQGSSLSRSHQKLGFPGGTSGKESACQRRRRQRHRFKLWAGKISWKRNLVFRTLQCSRNSVL